MTRENKLALVVGFGLILFVGILISDHFSVVRTQQAANLTEVLDPLVATSVEPVSLVDLIEKQPKPEPVQPEHLQEVPANTQASNVQPPVSSSTTTDPAGQSGTQGNIVLGADNDPAGEMLNNPPAGFEKVANPENDAFVFHEVAAGESLYSICRDQLGNVTGVQALADFNNLDDPGSLRVGQRLRIPRNTTSNESAASADNAAVDVEAPKSTAKPAAKPKAQVTYTVRKGDTLRVIALRMTGHKKNWEKIYNLNKDVIDDPNNVKVGTVLRIS